MIWTDEAVAVLKRLAREGRSASDIAAALGAASRNAVIGKANRIGVKLNGDGRAIAPDRAPAARPRCRAGGAKRAEKTAAAEVEEMRRVRLEDIRQAACRWPIGDPGAGDFAYCGRGAVAGRSYCVGHCRMAYRPPAAGRSRYGQGRSNSLADWRWPR